MQVIKRFIDNHLEAIFATGCAIVWLVIMTILVRLQLGYPIF